MIIETHCHLDYFDNPDDIIQKALENEITQIITIGVSHENQDRILDIAKHPNVFCSQGIHPHEAKNTNDSTWLKIRKNINEFPKKVVAIGECGLDYYYEHSPKKIQQNVFERQLQMASQLDLPVIIHTREADEDTLAILKNHSSSLKNKGVLHSFTSGFELADFAIKEGFYLGFNGIATFKNANHVKELVRRTPIDKILTETDAPYFCLLYTSPSPRDRG